MRLDTKQRRINAERCLALQTRIEMCFLKQRLESIVIPKSQTESTESIRVLNKRKLGGKSDFDTDNCRTLHFSQSNDSFDGNRENKIMFVKSKSVVMAMYRT